MISTNGKLIQSYQYEEIVKRERKRKKKNFVSTWPVDQNFKSDPCSS